MRRFAFVNFAVICLGVSGLLAQQDRPLSLGEVLQEGRRYLDPKSPQRNPERACQLYQEAAERLTGFHRAIILRELARTLTEMKEYARAIEVYEKLMSGYSLKDDQRYSALASILQLSRNLGKAREYADKARADLDRTLKQNPDKRLADEMEWRTHCQLADFCFSMGWYKEAVADYDAALPLAPEYQACRMHNQLLLIYEKTRDYEGIIKECTALLSARIPQRRTPYKQKLAEAYFLTGSDDKGIAALGEADPEATAFVAEKLLAAGRFDACEGILNAALDKARGDQKLLCLLAKLNWYRDRCDEALGIYLLCYNRAATYDQELFDIAASISDVHIDRKDTDEAAAAERSKADVLLAQNDPTEKHRDEVVRSLLLAGLMEHDAGDYSASLGHLAQLAGMLPAAAGLMKSVRNQIVQTALAAISDSIAEGRLEDAERALDILKENRFDSLATGYAQYVILDRRGQKEEAAAKLRAIRTIEAGVDAAHSYAAHFLASIGLMDLAIEEWKRTLETKPHNSQADRMAAVRLGEYFSDQENYEEAVKWFDRANAMEDKPRSLRYDLYWNRRELEARFKAAHDDPDIIALFLGDERLSYRVAALELLKDFGVPKHIWLIEEESKGAAPEIQAAAKAAIVGIESRFRFQLELGLLVFDEDTLKKTLSEKLALLWLSRDLMNSDLRWAALKKGFVLLADIKQQALYEFSDSLGLLDGSLPTPICIAFSPEAVWVGTDSGAFAYDRESRKWSQYAIMGKIADAPIDKIERAGDKWLFSVRGRGRFLFETKERSWRTLSEQRH